MKGINRMSIMKNMIGIVHFVVNEGDIIYASNDKDTVDAYAENKIRDAMDNEAEVQGVRVDELDEDELDDLGFMTGYNGGFYYTDYVEVTPLHSLNSCFDDAEGNEHTFEELADVYEYIKNK